MFWTITKLILWPVFKVFYRFSTRGREHIPVDGPVLLVSNHASYMDPVVVGLASRRPVLFMAKEQLFEIFGLGWIIRRLNAFPVKRTAFDRRAVQTALTALESGKVVGIFPQGTRQKDGEFDAYPGAALIAYKSGATIVPTAIRGTDKVMPDGTRLPRFPKITVSFGPPIKPDRVGEKKEVMAELTDQIVKELRAMLE